MIAAINKIREATDNLHVRTDHAAPSMRVANLESNAQAIMELKDELEGINRHFMKVLSSSLRRRTSFDECVEE